MSLTECYLPTQPRSKFIMPVPSRLLKVGVVLLYCRFRGRKMMSPCPLKPFKDRILEQSIPELSNYCRHGFLMFFFFVCTSVVPCSGWPACSQGSVLSFSF